jgi:xanthine dehydrogenase/oxidase
MASSPSGNAVSQDLVFQINDDRFALRAGTYDPAQTLVSFLRENTRYTGTKISCSEGGCGACTVMGSWFPTAAHAQRNEPIHRSLNACLRVLAQCDGMVITTTEGIGSHRNTNGYHAVQKCIAKNNGSQCGMCTPGMVMALYSYLVAKPESASTTPDNASAKVEQALDGNLCRCTGYRPLLSSAHELVQPGASSFQGPEMPHEFRTRAELMLVSQPHSSTLSASNAVGLAWVRPVTLSQVVDTLASLGTHARIVNGHTSFGVARSMVAMDNLAYSNLLPDNAEAGQVNVDISRVSELWTNGELHTQAGQVVTSSLSAFLSHTSTQDNLPTKVIFGSAVSMTDMASKLDALITSLPASQTASFAPLVKHLHRVAGYHVRNVGSWVGGLVLARDRGFPSDLAVVLSAAGAKLAVLNVVTGAVQRVPISDYVGGFGSNSSDSEVAPELVVSIEIPLSCANTHFESFKTALRVQNAHALVNAAFSCVVDAQGVVSNARVVYGALGKDVPFMSATTVEYALNGKTLGPDLLDAGMAALHTQVVPAMQAESAYITAAQPQGKLAFRRSIVLTFFYKFYLGLMYRFRRQSLDPRLISACCEPLRPAMQATETFEPAEPDMSPVGQPIPKRAALLQAAGEAKYAGDAFAATGAGSGTQGVLHGAMVLNNQRPTGTLAKLDASAVLAMPGVVRVLTAADIPGVNAGASEQEPLFVPINGKVCYLGQPVALVVATSAYLAENAAKLVEVHVTHSGDAGDVVFNSRMVGGMVGGEGQDITDIVDVDGDEEPALTIADAVRLSRFYPLKPALSELHCGDVKEAFETAHCTAEVTVNSGPSVHFYIEKQTTVAVPDEDRVVVYPATQHPPVSCVCVWVFVCTLGQIR